MNRISKIVSALLVAAFAASCGDAGPGPDSTYDDTSALAAALELDNGGLTALPEEPMFGQPEIFAAIGEAEADVPALDPEIEDPAVAAALAAPEAKVYHVGIVWGMLRFNPDNPYARVWDGTLSVNRGAVIVRRTIRFEPDTDYLLPRTDPRVIPYASATMPHNDGLLVTIVDAPALSDPADTSELTITLNAPEATFSSPVAALVMNPTIVAVDDIGNQIAAVGVEPDLDGCPSGFLGGRWHRVRAGLGVFFGRFVGELGVLHGHVRGLYGVRADGEQVFFGKYIASDGSFQGILVGNYADGQYLGRWIDANGVDRGAVGGRYVEVDAAASEIPAGFFIGGWEEFCDPAADSGAGDEASLD